MHHYFVVSLAQLVAPWVLCAALYLEAGRRTWQALFMSTRQQSNEPLAILVRHDKVPPLFMLAWYVFWMPIMGIGWFLALSHSTSRPLIDLREPKAPGRRAEN